MCVGTIFGLRTAGPRTLPALIEFAHSGWTLLAQLSLNFRLLEVPLRVGKSTVALLPAGSSWSSNPILTLVCKDLLLNLTKLPSWMQSVNTKLSLIRRNPIGLSVPGLPG
ncbi:hypothetical protein V6N13_072236 [Hibiscus sabdariffa]